MPDRNSCRAICFDLFHTLVDVAAAPGASGRYTADILGVERGAWNAACFSDLHPITRPSEHLEVVRALAHSINPDISLARIEEATVERQRRFDHALLSVEAEVLDTLHVLRRSGLRLALVSNASSGEVRSWPQSPLAELFDTALFSCDCGYRKPEPDIYRLALERLGVAAAESLFVGDGGSDEHRGAAAVGMTPVLITRHLGSMAAAELARRRAAAAMEIARVSQLLSLV